MAYTSSKTDWNEAFNNTPEQMNRIEGNIKAIKEEATDFDGDKTFNDDVDIAGTLTGVGCAFSGTVSGANITTTGNVTATGNMTSTGYSSPTGGVDPGASGTRIKSKVVPIGVWNMDSTDGVAVAHGLSVANVIKIVSVSAVIINDAQNAAVPLNHYDGSGTPFGTTDGGVASVDSMNVNLVRKASSFFDSTDFDSVAISRGNIIIWYYV